MFVVFIAIDPVELQRRRRQPLRDFGSEADFSRPKGENCLDFPIFVFFRAPFLDFLNFLARSEHLLLLLLPLNWSRRTRILCLKRYSHNWAFLLKLLRLKGN
jgi:hypothetical protein